MYKKNQRIPLNREKHTRRAMSGGFTLVELIVLCVILAIMAAIAVPALTGYIGRAKEKECAVNRKAILLQLESARVKKPEITMGDLLGGVDAQEIKCPSGGIYQAIGDNTVKCSIHGQDSTVSDKGHGNESIEGNPERPDTSDTQSTESQTESQSQATKPSEPPVTEPPEPDTPETESATEETESESKEKTLDEELTEISGSYESLWNYAMKQLQVGGSVENMTKGNVFKDKNGDYVIVSQTSISPKGLKNYEEIKDMNKQVHSSLIVMDMENIMNKDEYEAAWGNKKIRQGDVVKYGDTFYVAERNNPGKITTTGWLDGWIKVTEMTDKRFEPADIKEN